MIVKKKYNKPEFYNKDLLKHNVLLASDDDVSDNFVDPWDIDNGEFWGQDS